MTSFVLVPGAWHGGWCWKRVRAALTALGHEVFAPSLTGLGDRKHLLSPIVNLETHIEDITNLIIWEELSDVVLCGHSYGGCVISGVADRVGDRIKALLYLDAIVLDDGESPYDVMPPEYRVLHLEAACQWGDGYKIPPVPAERFNLNQSDRVWVDRLSTPHPIASFQQKLRLRNGPVRQHDISYIFASGWDASPFLVSSFERAKKRGWRASEVDCGHEIMLDMPDRVVAELIIAAKAL